MMKSTFINCLTFIAVCSVAEAHANDSKQRCLAASKLYPQFSQWIVQREADPSDPVELNEYFNYLDKDQFFKNNDLDLHLAGLRQTKKIEQQSQFINSFSMSKCIEEDSVKVIWYKIHSYHPEDISRVQVLTSNDDRIIQISYERRAFEDYFDDGLLYQAYLK